MPIISPKIPQGLEELMKGLAKSVIKENPENIYEFAAEYFENLLHERDGTVDQSYKKFATYKVYKKTRTERRKREKVSACIDAEREILKLENVPSNLDEKISTFDEDNSIEKITLNDAVEVSQDVMVSSESEIQTTIKQDSFVDDEGTPQQQKSVTSEDGEIIINKYEVLDEEQMSSAAVKIQSSYRGHRVRKELKEKNTEQSSEMVMMESDDMGEIRTDDMEVCDEGNSCQKEGSVELNNDSINETNLEMPENTEVVNEEENNQLENMEMSDNIKQQSNDTVDENLQPELKEDGVINSEENCSTETNENVLNDDEIVSDAKLSTESTLQQEEECENSVENNIQAENVVLMEVESNPEQIITNKSSQDTDNVEIKPNEVVVQQQEQAIIKSDDDDDVASGDMDIMQAAQSMEKSSDNNMNEGCENNDDVSSMILDDEMEGAALKIQSAFRGHQVRKDIKQQTETEAIIETPIDDPIECDGVEKEVLKDSENLVENKSASIEAVDENEGLENVQLVSTDELNEMEKIEEKTEAESGTIESVELNSIEKASNEQSIDDKFEVEKTTSIDENCENDSIENVSVELECSQSLQDQKENLPDEAVCYETTNEPDEILTVEIIEQETLQPEYKNYDELPTAKSTDDSEINQPEPSDTTGLLLENEIVNLTEVNDEKVSTVDINYEQLCESTDSLEKNIESESPMNEASADAETKSIESKNSTDSQASNGEQIEQEQVLEMTLESILTANISPYDLLDEVVNQEATLMVDEIASCNVDGNVACSVAESNESVASTETELVKNVASIEGELEENATTSKAELLDENIANTEAESDKNPACSEAKLDINTASIEAVTATLGNDENDDIKNMVLDDEMEKAALKIQSSFRGHKVRKNILEKKDDDCDNTQDRKSIESSVDERKESDFEKISNPELLDLSASEYPLNNGDEINDEILNPDQDESEIPEDDKKEINDIPFPEQENCGETVASELNPIDPLNEEKETETTTKESIGSEENVEDMILDEEMEGAALKIQAAFRGHQVRKERCSDTTNDGESKQENDSNNGTIVIDQCSEGNEEIQDNDETEQQDTSADVDEIQESEAVEQAETEQEETEDVKEEEEVEETTTETNEQGGDDPEEPEQDEGENSAQQQNNDDDDVANMVLDEEMEQAALKIQSTFRGHKTRSEIKSKQDDEVKTADEDPVENIEDDIANMVLDDEMEQAALKIQSAFRGKGSRSKKEDPKESEEENKEESQKEESEEAKSDEKEPTTSEDSSGKSAQQLQEEEDIANLVMDDEMEKTALKIQSAFRGKMKRKPQKDDMESCESEDYNADVEGSLQKSDENPSDMYEYFGMSVECDEDDYNDYLIKRESYADGGNYSVERENVMDAYFNETIYPSEYETDVDLMHGGGIFPETSGESGTLESMVDYSSNNNNNNDPPEDKDRLYMRVSTSSINDENQDSTEKKSEEKAIESFDFDTNKDTAEALYYSLKKNEIEAQKRFESVNMSQSQEVDDFQTNDIETNEMDMEEDDKSFDDGNNSEFGGSDDDDDDVVVSPLQSNEVHKLKYGMSMDDRLLGSILSLDYSKGRKVYPDEMFDPLLEEAMSSNYNVLDKLHEMSKSGDDLKIDDNNVGDEDQFDDFYPGNIRSKIMASSISIADSDYFDPTNNKSIIDDDRIRTALETIHSTDSESTIGSAATKIQAIDKGLATHRNKTFQYSSIGNAAIDKSLDEFIQSQELHIDRFDEEPEGYNSPPPKKQESVDDFTDDTCTESEKRPTMAGIIEIKLEQKHFLTVDERRRTLHREDAIQRNSTRSMDEDTSKSSNASHERVLEKSNSQSEAILATTTTAAVQGQNSVIDTEIAVPVLEKVATKTTSINTKTVKVPIRRQKTMPVQFESNVIRVLPKHLRKRIRSADSDKKKRANKQ